MIGLVVLCLIFGQVVLSHVTGTEEDQFGVNQETGTFETLGVASAKPGSDGAPDDEDAEIVGDNAKLTEFDCSGGKCRKLTKEDKQRRNAANANKRSLDKIQFDTVRRLLQTNDEGNMIADLERESVPTVVQNSALLRQWAAFEDWDFEYFANLWTLHHAMSPIFVTNSTVPGMKTDLFLYMNTSETAWPNVPKPYYETAMNLGTFFSGQCGKETPETWWWTKPFIALKDEQVEADTTPVSWFLDPQNKNASNPILSLVTGSRMATLQLHYEHEDSFIVQVHRKQQILLFSPEQMRQMYLYPWIHPHRRRSQVTPLADATESQFEGISKIRGIEAMLEPGDVLYIPRFWGHHIINYEPGISVQVNTNNRRDKDVHNFRNQLISLAHLTPHQRYTAGKYAIKRIAEPILYEIVNNVKVRSPLGLTPEEEAAGDYITEPELPVYERKHLIKFLKDHVKQRYSKLPSYLEDISQKDINLEVKGTCRHARESMHQLEGKDLLRLAMGLDSTVRVWKRIPDQNVRLLILHDWVDFIAWQATGDFRKVSAFLSRCF